MKNETTFQQIFPQGEKLPEQFSKYFIGQAYLAPLTQNKALNVPASNVTFGDYQTRMGLDARQREMLTFSMLVSLGGSESQVKGHIRGNDDGRRYYRRWWISVARGVSE